MLLRMKEQKTAMYAQLLQINNFEENAAYNLKKKWLTIASRKPIPIY